MEKKAQLSMQVIVVSIISILVLVVLVVIFNEQISALAGSFMNLIKGTTASVNDTTLNLLK